MSDFENFESTNDVDTRMGTREGSNGVVANEISNYGIYKGKSFFDYKKS